MLKILETDTKQGTVTPTEIADNILNIMGKKQYKLFKGTSLGGEFREIYFHSRKKSTLLLLYHHRTVLLI